MPDFVIALVEPRVEGNIGAVARVMANFGFRNLILVRPCAVGGMAFRRAMHASHILEEAIHCDSLDEALEKVDLVAGTTGIASSREKSFHRSAVSPEGFAAAVSELQGKIGIFLGRENYGLYNEELDRLDFLINIPCSPEYPVMNLSHAASILLYELRRTAPLSPSAQPRKASGFEKERLHQAFSELLSAVNYPEHKRRRAEVMFRRLMGRATPSKWDFYTFMGVLRGAAKTIQRGQHVERAAAPKAALRD